MLHNLLSCESCLWVHYQQFTDEVLGLLGDVGPHGRIKIVVASLDLVVNLEFII